MGEPINLQMIQSHDLWPDFLDGWPGLAPQGPLNLCSEFLIHYWIFPPSVFRALRGGKFESHWMI